MNEKLAEGYRKRVENFILNMNDKPIVLNDYVSASDLKS